MTDTEGELTVTRQEADPLLEVPPPLVRHIALEITAPMAHKKAWSRGEVTFEFRDDNVSGGSVITVTVTTPAGAMHLMADVTVENEGRRLRLSGVHMHSDGGSNALGTANLMRLGRWAIQETGFDELIIEGASRTTGARPGHSPRPLRFSGDHLPDPCTEPGDGPDGDGGFGPR